MDNEKTANENKQDRDRHEQRQSSKSNVHNYNELSDKAKSIFHKVQCGQKVATDEELMSDKEIMFAVHELIEGGFLIIHSNEEIYK